MDWDQDKDSPLYHERTYRLSRLAAELPPELASAKRCQATYAMWRRRGVLGADGKRHYLETIRVGGFRETSIEALRRFLFAMNHVPE